MEDKIEDGGSSKIYSIPISSTIFLCPSVNKMVGATEWTRRFAVKAVHDKTCAQRELRFLQSLRAAKFHHYNLLMSYCGFSDVKTDMYYLISEEARPDLEKVLCNTNPSDHGITIKWLRSQLYGLADALARIHEFDPNVQTGYLNDIKPANILVFGDQELTLKFTDWGCAKINQRSLEGSPDSRTTEFGGSPPYGPPECIEGIPTSRPYDIWSLGCMYLEMLVWMVEGKYGFTGFCEARSGDGGYEEFHSGRKVKPSVTRKMGELERKCEWVDVVGVIRDMLRVEAKERLKAAEVKLRLELIEE
ncbi:kinase-like protein [Ophiobolus disseminans]|uniref:Kinase-like protein n=1 Tax=Ophiobolus disseminans TaxID=1469910 RepID=A0A6A7AKY0_9PLEO|nr:kinase-like protein [Ophiobolus disseminans]